jgi:hypothetical protein
MPSLSTTATTLHQEQRQATRAALGTAPGNPRLGLSFYLGQSRGRGDEWRGKTGHNVIHTQTVWLERQRYADYSIQHIGWSGASLY